MLTGTHIRAATMGVPWQANVSAISFLKELDHRISQPSGDDRETQ